MLNGNQSCCCIGAQPIHADHITQRAGGAVVLTNHLLYLETPSEIINYNTWVNGGSPPHLAGRVDPAVWTAFVAAISELEMSQPGCLEFCLLCKCGTGVLQEFEAALAGIEARFKAALGATGFSKRVYTYLIWVPYQPETYGENGEPGSPARPAHWQESELGYLRIDFATPFAGFAAPAGMPMTMPPGTMMQNPMMQQQPQRPPQQMMYAGQQPTMYAGQQQQQPVMYAGQQQPQQQQPVMYAGPPPPQQRPTMYAGQPPPQQPTMYAGQPPPQQPMYGGGQPQQQPMYGGCY